MKVIPVAAPTDIKQAPPTDIKARAVAAFNKAAEAQKQQSTAQEHPVLNPNAVSVEELGAIKAQSSETIDKNQEDVGTAQEETAESTLEAKQEEKPKEDPALSRQFAQLARQERALRAKVQQQEQAIKAKEAALAEREAKIAAKDQEYNTGYVSKQRIKQDLLSVMAEEGMSYDELTQQLLNQQPKDPRVEATIGRLEAKIKSLEEANEASKTTYAEQQQAQYQAAVKQISLDAKQLVKSDPVAYEAIAKTGSVKDVVELITETYNKDGVLLSVEEAAQQVEDYLVEEGLNTITKIDKIKRRMEANAQKASTSSKGQSASVKPQQQQTMKTLTNAAASSRQLSAKERAILAFKGELKS